MARIGRARGGTGGVLAALILPSLGGNTVEQLAEKTFKTWHLGENGVLVVSAIQERRSRIETGLAVERVITDDEGSAILRPDLRQGDFFGGLDETFEALLALPHVRKAPKKCDKMLARSGH